MQEPNQRDMDPTSDPQIKKLQSIAELTKKHIAHVKTYSRDLSTILPDLREAKAANPIQQNYLINGMKTDMEDMRRQTMIFRDSHIDILEKDIDALIREDYRVKSDHESKARQIVRELRESFEKEEAREDRYINTVRTNGVSQNLGHFFEEAESMRQRIRRDLDHDLEGRNGLENTNEPEDKLEAKGKKQVRFA
ncbi:hypothetical protein BDV95DRAFT_599526 [Massariosphaeria phaeospora]|uniref:Uncharacterized protein n=1 Tax=Massariosphaeria phaeospora TaxID=100035 RepID=A0A7C8M235_9PLEO|nr:hypothetical protein BDV95DRAFT_599526 [Massariosphaeria phaeospora]